MVLPISFVRVLQRVAGQSLAAAKANLDAFSEHGEVTIAFEDDAVRDEVARELETLGAACVRVER